MKIDSRELQDAIEDQGPKLVRDMADEWFSRSQERLYTAGDEHGYEVFPVAQSGQPPEWDSSREAWVFSYPHLAAPFFEFGTAPHEIEAHGGFLAFEWPDAPPEIRERFKETFPTVFFKRVRVDGIDALKYLRGSRNEVMSNAR